MIIVVIVLGAGVVIPQLAPVFKPGLVRKQDR